MNSTSLIRAVVFLFFAAFLFGCPGNNNPTSPEQPAPTPTLSPTPVVLSFYNYYLFDANNYVGCASGCSNPYVDVQLLVNGGPCTTAVSTVVGAGQTIVPALTGTAVNNCYAVGVTVGDYQAYGFTYAAGVTYVFTTAAYGVTASSSVVGPGPRPTLVVDALNGAVTQVRWQVAGQNGYVAVDETGPGTSHWYTGAAGLTFVDVPDSGVSNAYPHAAPSIYTLRVMIQNSNLVILNGVNACGGCQVEEYLNWPVTLH